MNKNEITNYIYLIQLREFIEHTHKQKIFKIGKTTQKRFNRLNGYPKGSELIIWIKCQNCHKIENEIIQIFKNTFLHKKEYGNEYFEGDSMSMIKIICNIIENENNIIGERYNVIENKDDIVENDIVENDDIIENEDDIVENTNVCACKNIIKCTDYICKSYSIYF